MSEHFPPANRLWPQWLLASWRESAWCAVLPVLLPMVLANFLLWPTLEYVPPLAVGVALIPVQAALLTILLVLGPGPFWRRWLWHWGWVLVLFGSWSAGYYLAVERKYLEVIPAAACGLPLFALIVQLPFWVLRAWIGWRLVRRTERPLSPDSTVENPAVKDSNERLRVIDLMQATAVIAMTLGIARLTPVGSSGGTQVMVWSGILLGSTAAMVVGAFAVLPILWIFSYETTFESRWGFTSLYAFFWIVVTVLLLQREPPLASALVLILICFGVVFCAGLTLILLNGFQIQRGRG